MDDEPTGSADGLRASLAGPRPRRRRGTPRKGVGQGCPVATEAEVLQSFRDFYEGLFPKVCPNCGRVFGTLREYVLASEPLWPSLNYDIELGNYRTPNPIGGLAMANCSCGTTMALSTKTMPVSRSHLIMAWIRTEAKRRGITATELLDHLRDEVRRQILAEMPAGISSAARKAARPQSPGAAAAPRRRDGP